MCWRQGPFTLEHLRLLAEEDVVTSDKIVLHAAHGPSLLRAVLAMPAAQGRANSVQHASQEGGDPANHAASNGYGPLLLASGILHNTFFNSEFAHVGSRNDNYEVFVLALLLHLLDGIKREAV